MGDSSNEPQPPPLIVVDSKYVSPIPRVLRVNRVFELRTAKFQVLDEEKKILFEVAGKKFPIHDKKIVSDEAGKPIVTLCFKRPSLHQRLRCYNGGAETTNPKDLLFTCKYPYVVNRITDTHIDVYLVGNTKEEISDFKITGNWMADTCAIYVGDSDKVVGQISRRSSLSQLEDSYKLTLWPNVDQAFVVALAVALDEITHGEVRLPLHD